MPSRPLVVARATVGPRYTVAEWRQLDLLGYWDFEVEILAPLSAPVSVR